MFHHIANNGVWTTTDKIRHFAKGSKQFYNHMAMLVKTGLVRRANHKYYLTRYGRVISTLYEGFERATESYYGLKVVDTIEQEQVNIPQDEYNKLLVSLIPDERVRDMLHK
jgi:hypothetical protein